MQAAYDASFGYSASYDASYLERARVNFELVFAATRELGGVPEMLSYEDVKDFGPDEKAVVAFLTFLCARLLEARRDNNAASYIQVHVIVFKIDAEPSIAAPMLKTPKHTIVYVFVALL